MGGGVSRERGAGESALSFEDGFPSNRNGDRSSPYAAVSDADGRFVITGLGANQLVTLFIRGAGTADKQVVSLNRDGFDPAPVVKLMKAHQIKGVRPDTYWTPYGPDPTVVLDSEKIIRGRVTDQGGNPQAGVGVLFSRTNESEVNHDYNRAVTDDDGRYEIRGARKHKEYMVEVASNPTTGTMMCQAFADDTVGYEPVTIDVKCKKGVVVSGRVTNKATGQPIRAMLKAAVLKDNPFADQYPTFIHAGTGGNSYGWADKDGRFRVVTIPGPVLLIARGDSREDSGYKPPVPDPDHPHYFMESESTLLFTGYRNGREHLNGCWCKVLNAKSTDQEVTVNVELEPATRTPVRVVDADGKPVTGTRATGVQHLEFAHPSAFPDTDTLTVLNLEAKKERLLAVFHEKRKLVGTLTLTADTMSPVVKLGAGGAVTGRAVGKDGKPLVGLTVTTRYTRRAATEAFNAFHKNEFPTTDANGEFRVDGLFPGQEFKLFYTRDRRSYGLEVDPTPAYTLAIPGETRKVGEMVLLIDHE